MRALNEEAQTRLSELSLAQEHAAPAQADVLKLLYELQVHQVELSMQNEELERARMDATSARDRYMALYDDAPIAYYTLACPQATIEEVNVVGAALLGLQRQLLQGRRLDSFLTPASQAAFNALLANTGRDMAAGMCEVELLGTDGEPRAIQAEVKSDTDGRSFLVAFIDITDRRRAEQAQRVAFSHAQASRAKSEFLSRVSQELRTPLNSVLGFAQLMLLNPTVPLKPAQQVQLDFIQDAGLHLLRLVDEILDIAQIESGQQRIVIEPHFMGQLARACLPMVTKQAAAMGISLICSAAADDDCAVLADAKRMRQVLVNLLSNAVKFNQPGGEVRVTWRHDAQHGYIDVQDSGIGMSPAQLQAMFQPFNRLDENASNTSGFGLGLTLSRVLVEAMNGRLEVRSQSKEGTTVSVRLPRANPPPAPSLP